MTDRDDKELSNQIVRIHADMILHNTWIAALARALASAVNRDIERIKAESEPTMYCPGCGEPAASATDLCDECMIIEEAGR